MTSGGPDADSPVLNRSKKGIKGRLKFELVECSRYQHMAYSHNLVFGQISHENWFVDIPMARLHQQQS